MTELEPTCGIPLYRTAACSACSERAGMDGRYARHSGGGHGPNQHVCVWLSTLRYSQVPSVRLLGALHTATHCAFCICCMPLSTSCREGVLAPVYGRGHATVGHVCSMGRHTLPGGRRSIALLLAVWAAGAVIGWRWPFRRCSLGESRVGGGVRRRPAAAARAAACMGGAGLPAAIPAFGATISPCSTAQTPKWGSPPTHTC